MSPRASAAAARRTRERLLDAACEMSSTEGLEGMTLGRLADACGLSKSGITRHFESKEELQLVTLRRALDRFAEVVWEPVAARPEGLARLRALCDAWTAFLAGDTFPGGCYLTAAAAELDGRPGPLRDATAEGLQRWLRAIGREARTAVERGELPAGTEPRTLAHELLGLALAANQCRQLLGDDDAPERSRALMHARLDALIAPAHR